jgi:hypothetical protein
MKDKTIVSPGLSGTIKEVHFEEGLRATNGLWMPNWNSSVPEVPDGGVCFCRNTAALQSL